MATPPGGFDMQNFFTGNTGNRSPSPSPNPSSASPSAPYPPPQYYNNGNQNLPLMNNSFSFPSSSAPPPPPPQFHHQFSSPNPNSPRISFYLPYSNASPATGTATGTSGSRSPNLDGAHLMHLLTAHSSGENAAPNSLELPPPALGSGEYSHQVPPPAMSPTIPTAPPQPPAAPRRLSSTKVPRGRQLKGEHVVYDVDARLPGEAQPQLEVTPIANYTSERVLALGRQIAVNKNYICYALRAGNIRVLNIHTASRQLLRGHSQRVTDMAFFSEDVHILASASSDGKVYVRKIVEDIEEDKNQITEEMQLAFQIKGSAVTFHPRVCWHSHRQDVLFVGIGKHVLKIDITRSRLSPHGSSRSSEDPYTFHIENPVDGVYNMGRHNDDVTDMSINYCITPRLATASKDGTVIIWDDNTMVPLVNFQPHRGQPVNAVAFLTSPRHPDHLVLLTAGPLCRELKLWVSANLDGWLSSPESEKWTCIQTLELRSSLESEPENAFFNHIVALPGASLILLANWKRNAIYAIHVDYSSKPLAMSMDYLAEFSVTYPILSITARSDDMTDFEGTVKIYCVQTTSIQQYTLDLFQCLPPAVEMTPQEKDAALSRTFEISSSSAFTPVEPTFSGGISEKVAGVFAATAPSSSQVPVPLSPRLSGKQPHPKSPLRNFDDQEYSMDRKLDSATHKADDGLEKEDGHVVNNYISSGTSTDMTNDCMVSSNTTHLITPSQLLSMTVSSDQGGPLKEVNKADFEDSISTSETQNVKLLTREESIVTNQSDQAIKSEFENSNSSKFLGQSDNASERTNSLKFEARNAKEDVEEKEQPSNIPGEDYQNSTDSVGKVSEPGSSNTVIPSPGGGKGKKSKKCPTGSVPSSTSGSPFASLDSSDGDPAASTSSPSVEAISTQFLAMQDTLNQVLSMHKELQKQMSVMIGVPVAKEGKRIEASLGQRMEKAVKAQVDALWARLQEENAKRDKAEKERIQQLTTSLNSVSKELPTTLERVLKKELGSLSPSVARTITPVLEKSIITAVNEAFQKGVNEKTMSQLEKSIGTKLETSVSRQIQTQFQSSGKQALQDALRSSFESSVIPAFERSCKAMFDQVDTTFQKGMSEHTASVQQQFASSQTALASTLQEAVSSATSLAQSLKGELADGQRRLIALAETAGTSLSRAQTPNIKQGNAVISNLPEAISLKRLEESLDPTKEISRLLTELKYEEAFHKALQMVDVSLVSWLCSQVDPQTLFTIVPFPLSQGVLLSLVQQLSCDIGKDTPKKLVWIREAALQLNPNDPRLAGHMRPILGELYQSLHRHMLMTSSAADASAIRLVMHVVNSILTSCK